MGDKLGVSNDYKDTLIGVHRRNKWTQKYMYLFYENTDLTVYSLFSIGIFVLKSLSLW